MFASENPRHVLAERISGILPEKKYSWERYVCEGAIPSPRNSCGAVIHKGAVFVFGGYDGTQNFNDVFRFDIAKHEWACLSKRNPPAPRNSFTVVNFRGVLYLFGGFDGTTRFNDLRTFNLETHTWGMVHDNDTPNTPSRRSGHGACVSGNAMYVYGGTCHQLTDSTSVYFNDLWRFDFITRTWTEVTPGPNDQWPAPVYTHTFVAHEDSLYLFGGFDYRKRNANLFEFNTVSKQWRLLTSPSVTSKPLPSKRSCHTACVLNDRMYVFGGFNGERILQDMWEYNFLTNEWVELHVPNSPSGRNFSMLLPCAEQDGLIVFGGYDGERRLNDVLKFHAGWAETRPVPETHMPTDIGAWVNNPLFSDLQFNVRGQRIVAHRAILCMRCDYFRSMLTGSMREARMDVIQLDIVTPEVFLKVLEYIYADSIKADDNLAVDLLTAANLFGLHRMQLLCEDMLVKRIDYDNVMSLLSLAEMYNAQHLRTCCLVFMRKNLVKLDPVTMHSLHQYVEDTEASTPTSMDRMMH